MRNDSERAVIGSVLASQDCMRYVMELNADDFEDQFCRTVFTAEKALFEAGQGIDIVTVGKWMEDRSGNAVNAKELLLSAVEPTAANVRTYIRAVKDASNRRKVIRLALELSEKARDPTEDLQVLVDDFKLASTQITSGKSDWMSMAEMDMKGFEWLEKKNSGEVQFIRSGISSLDSVIGGFYPNELTVLAARPAVGKSALGLFMGLNAARAGKKVAMVSREMSPEAIFQRAISNESPQLRGERLRKEKLSEEEWVAAGDAVNSMQNLPFSTIYTVKTVEQLHRQAMILKDRQGLDFLIVDYAQLMHTDHKAASRVEELESVSGALKDLAMDLTIPVLALAQVKRSGSRTPIMPTMDELKGSGAFEQDADGIILIHRCEVESDPFVNPKDKGLFQQLQRDGRQYIALNIAKQRQGQIGIVNLVFDPSHMMYTPIERWP